MSRVQLALNVDDLEQAVAFYTKLFGVEPAKRRPGYANFADRRPAAQAGAAGEPRQGRQPQPPRRGGRLQRRRCTPRSPGSTGEGLFTDEEIGTTCCFATQDKVWVTGPGGERWEVYTVLADSETFGASPRAVPAGENPGGTVCCGGAQPAGPEPGATATAACC